MEVIPPGAAIQLHPSDHDQPTKFLTDPDLGRAIGGAWDATGGKAVAWADDHACGIATAASYIATGLAVGAFVAGTIVAAPAVAAGLAAGAIVAGGVRVGAGIAAGASRHVVGGVAQMVAGGHNYLWYASRSLATVDFATRAAAGATGVAVSGTGAYLGRQSGGGC